MHYYWLRISLALLQCHNVLDLRYALCMQYYNNYMRASRAVIIK